MLFAGKTDSDFMDDGIEGLEGRTSRHIEGFAKAAPPRPAVACPSLHHVGDFYAIQENGMFRVLVSEFVNLEALNEFQASFVFSNVHIVQYIRILIAGCQTLFLGTEHH